MQGSNDYIQQDTQTSKYNDAGLSVVRLNNHYTEAEYYANKGHLSGWKFKLDSIWRELYPDVVRLITNKKATKAEMFGKNILLMQNIADAKTPVKLYFALNARHEFLRELQDKAGKAGVYVNENDEDFE